MCALSAAEKMKCKAILGLPEVGAYTFQGDDPDKLLDGVAAHVETEIRENILPVWADVAYDEDELERDGLTSKPGKTRGRLKTVLAGLLGLQAIQASANRPPRVIR